MLDDPTQLLEEQLEESKKLIKSLKDENKYLEKEVQKKEAKAKKAEELEAKNNFLNGTIERMKKTEEELKNQKKKFEDDFKKEIERYETNLGQIKVEFQETEILKTLIGIYDYNGENKKPKFGNFETQRHWMEITINLE